MQRAGERARDLKEIAIFVGSLGICSGTVGSRIRKWQLGEVKQVKKVVGEKAVVEVVRVVMMVKVVIKVVLRVGMDMERVGASSEEGMEKGRGRLVYYPFSMTFAVLPPNLTILSSGVGTMPDTCLK